MILLTFTHETTYKVVEWPISAIPRKGELVLIGGLSDQQGYFRVSDVFWAVRDSGDVTIRVSLQ